MILDKEVEMTTDVALDLESVRPGPGNPIKLFATGFTPGVTIVVTTGVDAAESDGGTVPGTTATTGSDGTVEFELPSTIRQFITATFTGELHVILPGAQTNV